VSAVKFGLPVVMEDGMVKVVWDLMGEGLPLGSLDGGLDTCMQGLIYVRWTRSVGWALQPFGYEIGWVSACMEW